MKTSTSIALLIVGLFFVGDAWALRVKDDWQPACKTEISLKMILDDCRTDDKIKCMTTTGNLVSLKECLIMPEGAEVEVLDDSGDVHPLFMQVKIEGVKGAHWAMPPSFED